jgi:hypothetical protein
MEQDQRRAVVGAALQEAVELARPEGPTPWTGSERSWSVLMLTSIS